MKVKRILSSIMAAVMVATSLVAVNVSNVWAAAPVTTAKEKSWDYSGATAGNAVNANETIDEILVYTSDKVKTKEGCLSVNGVKIGIPVPDGSTGNITITAGGDDTTRYFTMELNENQVATNIPYATKNASGTLIDQTASFDSTVSKDGWVDLTATKEYKVKKIVVNIESNHSYKVGTTYTLTGDCSGLDANTEFKLGDFTATVNADGKGYTITTQSTVDESQAYEVAVLKDTVVTYGDNKTGVTFKAGENNTYTANEAINFTKNPALTALTEASYSGIDIYSGLPNFRISGEDRSMNASYCRIRGTVDFILGAPKEVTINAECANRDSTSGKNVTFSIDGATINGEESITLDGGSSFADYKVTLPAGEHTLNIVSNSTDKTSLEINTITLKDAVIADAPAFKIIKISPTDDAEEFIVIGQFDTANNKIEDYAEVGIRIGKTKECNNPVITSDTLYKGVKLSDTKVFNADDYSLFAVLVSGVNKNDSIDNKIYAMGYSKKVGATEGVYSDYSSRIIEESATEATSTTGA